MTSKFALISLLFWLGFSTSVTAQAVALDDPVLRPSGEAYENALRFRSIDTGVVYFDPNRPPPPFETQQSPTADLTPDLPTPSIETTFTGGRLILLVLMAAILFGVIYLVLTFGGGSLAAFARQPEEGGTGVKNRKPRAEQRPMTHSLQAILGMKDRNLALVALCKTLLAKVVSAEGVLIQKSWTDRDTLRRVPAGHSYRDALQSLVYESEKTQFGGRDVTEEEFRAHVSRLRPLMTGAAT